MSASAVRDNVALLEAAAAALGPLIDEVVFVGGATVALHFTSPTTEVRATVDVDVVTAGSRANYMRIDKELEKLGFRLPPSDHEDAKIHCRRYHGDVETPLILDVMPDDASVAGFSNNWYKETVEHAKEISLPSGKRIRVAAPTFLLATKLEALFQRDQGACEYKDLEDIAALLVSRTELIDEVLASHPKLIAYIRKSSGEILDHQEFSNVLPGMVAGPFAKEHYALLVERLETLAQRSKPPASASETVARWLYDNFRLAFPTLEDEGIWSHEGSFSFVARKGALKRAKLRKKDVEKWFKDNRPIGFAIGFEILDDLPLGHRASERTTLERLVMFGFPRNRSDLEMALATELPRDFPTFAIGSDGQGFFEFHTETELTAEQKDTLDAVVLSLGLGLKADTKTARLPSRGEFKSTRHLRYLPARLLPPNTPLAVRERALEDEETWRSIRSTVLAPVADPAPSVSRIQVPSSSFFPQPLGAYLSIYDEVLLEMPLHDRMEGALEALGVQKSRLLELVSEGRVRFLCPQSLERYPTDFLAETIERRASSVVMSRELSVRMLRAITYRLPILSQALPVRERRKLLELLSALGPLDKSEVFTDLVAELENVWSSHDEWLYIRGVMAAITCGFGSIFANATKSILGDKVIEISSAYLSMEMAMAFGAHISSVTADGYSDTNALRLLAGTLNSISSWDSNLDRSFEPLVAANTEAAAAIPEQVRHELQKNIKDWIHGQDAPRMVVPESYLAAVSSTETMRWQVEIPGGGELAPMAQSLREQLAQSTIDEELPILASLQRHGSVDPLVMSFPVHDS
ncbi:MAG: nucleotidyl transferase AbiEii/AbiGii toxin family protein [Myxococcales bacterium]|nr:nucleotidyl transferase AbiEii/AbiGii toxin family protein [Myxococcales bacterium]